VSINPSSKETHPYVVVLLGDIGEPNLLTIIGPFSPPLPSPSPEEAI
jgi:hypothetical protein